MDGSGKAARGAALRARWHRGKPLALTRVAVTDSEAVLAELGGTLPQELGNMSLHHPALDVSVRNRGDHQHVVRRIHVELKKITSASPAHSPEERSRVPDRHVRLPTWADRRQAEQIRPTSAYRVQIPRQEGSYHLSANQLIDRCDVDRFLISLVTPEGGSGPEEYSVTLTLDCGRRGRGPGRLLSTAAPVRVRM
jgi:hypothetical protein